MSGTPSHAVCSFSILEKCQANLTNLNTRRSPAVESLDHSETVGLIAHAGHAPYMHLCSYAGTVSKCTRHPSCLAFPEKTYENYQLPWYSGKIHKILKIHPENDDIPEGSSISLVLHSINMHLLGELVKYKQHHAYTTNHCMSALHWASNLAMAAQDLKIKSYPENKQVPFIHSYVHQ